MGLVSTFVFRWVIRFMRNVSYQLVPSMTFGTKGADLAETLINPVGEY